MDYELLRSRFAQPFLSSFCMFCLGPDIRRGFKGPLVLWFVRATKINV